ncbi:Renalase [Lamellibrachia satsuma]|nr:Renalase [Lamellibrachia satsuma]
MLRRILVVGAGITGAVTASLLRTALSKEWQIFVWETAGDSGGRMCTFQDSTGTEACVDMGAQYISTTPEAYVQHQRFYSALEQSGTLNPLTCVIEGDNNRHPKGTRHFVPRLGMKSIVTHFLDKSEACVSYNRAVTDVSERGAYWQVTDDRAASSETFDCVVLTMPVPQVLGLSGSIQDVIDKEGIREKLKNVTYSSRFALGLFYEPGTEIDVPWTVKYIFDDPCIRFVAIDSKKRDLYKTGTSVVIHTSVPFAMDHSLRDMEDICTNVVLPATRRLFPQLPHPKSALSHKWLYSQVFQSYEGEPGALVVSKRPLLICTGDAFHSSTFDGCLNCAVKSMQLVTQHLSCDV